MVVTAVDVVVNIYERLPFRRTKTTALLAKFVARIKVIESVRSPNQRRKAPEWLTRGAAACVHMTVDQYHTYLTIF